MTLPGLSQIQTDGALALDTGSDDYSVAVGLCSAGVSLTKYVLSDPAGIASALGVGPLAEAVAFKLAVSHKPVIAIPCAQAAAGTLGTFTHVGTSPQVTDDTTPSAPNDAYQLIVKYALGGARGTARFSYSLDGGDSWSGAVLTAATVALPGTGITLAFPTGTYVAGDTSSADCTAPAFDSTGLAAAVAVALADSRRFRLIHVIGTTSTAAALATIVASLETQVAAAMANGRYCRVVLEAPAVSDSALESAFAATSAKHVAVVVGSCELPSQLAVGRVHTRPFAWPAVARILARPIHEHPGKVANGPLDGGIVSISRDERTATTSLDGARFVTARTFVDGGAVSSGFYVTNGYTMAPAGSDFSELQRCMVLDRACEVAWSAMLSYVNADLVLNADGTIEEAEARGIEAAVLRKLETGLLGTNGHASAVEFAVSRTQNVGSTQKLKYKVRVRPKGYAKFIEGEVGFAAPSVAAA